MAEVVGHVPGFVRSLCANRKTRQMKQKEDAGDDIEDEGFEMVQNNMYANPLADLEAAKAQAAREKQRNKQLQQANKDGDKQRSEMMAQMKRLKQQNQRNLISIKGAKDGHRTPRKRKEMVSAEILQVFSNSMYLSLSFLVVACFVWCCIFLLTKFLPQFLPGTSSGEDLTCNIIRQPPLPSIFKMMI